MRPQPLGTTHPGTRQRHGRLQARHRRRRGYGRLGEPGALAARAGCGSASSLSGRPRLRLAMICMRTAIFAPNYLLSIYCSCTVISSVRYCLIWYQYKTSHCTTRLAIQFLKCVKTNFILTIAPLNSQYHFAQGRLTHSLAGAAGCQVCCRVHA